VQTTHNLIAVSANNKETAINVEQALDTGILVARSSMVDFDKRNEPNSDEATGKEEADDLYFLGGLANFAMEFPRTQAQHVALVAAYALGQRSTVAAGATGYKHTFTPIDGDLDAARSNPSFTLAQRLGSRLVKERSASHFIDSFRLTLAKDSWVRLSATVPGTGKKSTTVKKDTVNAAYNAASLTLSAKIAGGDGAPNAQNRLDNVHHVRVKVPVTGECKDVIVTAASDAALCVLTITAPGGVATATDYEVIYNQNEAGAYSWGSFPSRIVEPPLRTSDFMVNLGGKWDGSQIVEGHPVQADINSLEWSFENNMRVEFVPGAGSGQYANRALREGRNQRLTFDRVFRDYILGQRRDDSETFVVYAKAEGSEYEASHKYTVELIFPKVGVIATPRREDGKRLSEAADLVILQDDTYGSVIVNVKNKAAAYAA
jgi:hypothetical protein